jgi:hypothetical protein
LGDGSEMRRLFAHGWLVLLLCSTVLALDIVIVYAASRIWLRPDFYTRHFPDTPDYEKMGDKDLTDPTGLADIRTWGYPLVVKAVRTISPDYALLPWIHLVLHVGGVLVLYAGLRQVGFTGVAAVLVCVPSLFADLITEQLALHHVLTDALGHSLLLTTFGAFFLVLARPQGPLRWLLLTLAIFAAYQTRPAFQGLVVIIPACAVALRAFLPRERSRALFLGKMALAALGPYLAFCTLRYVVVGHFGLVAFTGTNLVGITGVILTEDMVPHIRPEHQPLAKWILKCRCSPDNWRREFNAFYPPIPPGGTIFDLQFDRLYFQYDEVQWQCAWRHAYHRLYHEDQIRAEKALLEFSLDVIRTAPEVYVTVVAHSFSRAVLYIVSRYATRVPLVIFCLLLMVAGVMRFRGNWSPERGGELRAESDLLTLISVPASALFLGQVLLTVLVAMPDPRYLDPATTLLPGIIMTANYLVGRRLWSRFPAPDAKPQAAQIPKLTLPCKNLPSRF